MNSENKYKGKLWEIINNCDHPNRYTHTFDAIQALIQEAVDKTHEYYINRPYDDEIREARLDEISQALHLEHEGEIATASDIVNRLLARNKELLDIIKGQSNNQPCTDELCSKTHDMNQCHYRPFAPKTPDESEVSSSGVHSTEVDMTSIHEAVASWLNDNFGDLQPWEIDEEELEDKYWKDFDRRIKPLFSVTPPPDTIADIKSMLPEAAKRANERQASIQPDEVEYLYYNYVGGLSRDHPLFPDSSQEKQMAEWHRDIQALNIQPDEVERVAKFVNGLSPHNLSRGAEAIQALIDGKVVDTQSDEVELDKIIGRHSKLWNYSKYETRERLLDLLRMAYQRGLKEKE